MDGLTDPVIRSSLKDMLTSRFDQTASIADSPRLVIDELLIDDRNVRVDLAILDTSLSGFEIKSDVDTLARLDRQQIAYSRLMTEATLVTTDKHLKRAQSVIPNWWHIILAAAGRDSVEFTTVQRGTVNPSRDPVALAHLIWRDDLVKLIRRVDSKCRVNGMFKDAVARLAAEVCPFEMLHQQALISLRQRVAVRVAIQQTWRGRKPQVPSANFSRLVSDASLCH